MHGGDVERCFGLLRQEMLAILDHRIGDESGIQDAVTTVARHLRKARLPASLHESRRLPGCRHLPAAIDLAREGTMARLASAFVTIEPMLRWIRTEHYRENLGDVYMENYCYTNILGFDALIPHERIVAGFLIIGPGQRYPRHHHEAEEIYFPFGGDTLWGQNDEELRPRCAGKPIHNTPWLPHEMITRTTPLFTFCIWVSPGPIRLARLT